MNTTALQLKTRGLIAKAKRQQRGRRRRGAVMALMAILLPVLAILAAVSINSAYVQLTRTELMVATDAAARAGGRAFSQLQDVDDAQSYAAVTAALNNVAGEPLRISTVDDVDIDFGYSEREGAGYSRYTFTEKPTARVRNGSAEANAVRVAGRRDSGSLGGEVDVVFPAFVSQKTFEPTYSSTAMQVDRDIALVLDRSGSMRANNLNWPKGRSPWSYDAVLAGLQAGLLTWDRGLQFANGVTQQDYIDWVWQNHYNLGNPPSNPWGNLVSAVNAFLRVLKSTPQNEYVSLTTYATTSSLDLNLTNDYTAVRTGLVRKSPDGWTAIGDGMQDGWNSLANPSYARQFAAKTMVVMTDGNHNYGTAPETVLQSMLASMNVTVHTVTFGEGADQARMRQLAEDGGGNHYHAANGGQLKEVFEEIANNLPTIIID